MVLWNEQHLEELVRKMKLRRTRGQGKTPIHLNLYAPGNGTPLLTKIMWPDVEEWAALGYDENDRISLVRYLGHLGCRAEGSLRAAVQYQCPLALDLARALIDMGDRDRQALSFAAVSQKPLAQELAKLLIDAGCCDSWAFSEAAEYQHPLTLELARLLVDAECTNDTALVRLLCYQKQIDEKIVELLVKANCFSLKYCLRDWVANSPPAGVSAKIVQLLLDAGCDPTVQDGNGWDALVWLAACNHPVDPQVTDLFLSADCRTDLSGCENISDKFRLRFHHVLKEHALWKEKLGRISAENSLTDTFYGPDWGR